MTDTIITLAFGLIGGAGIASIAWKRAVDRLSAKYEALSYEHKRWTDRGPGGRFKGGKPS